MCSGKLQGSIEYNQLWGGMERGPVKREVVQRKGEPVMQVTASGLLE